MTRANLSIDFAFPTLGDARFNVSIKRTVRLPDTGTPHYLPPSFGSLPLVDHEGGLAVPLHHLEAIWIAFGGVPCAVRIGVGLSCAITGKAFGSDLSGDPQNYLSAPSQPWLDGFKTADGTVRQFVAARLGQGLTVDEQLTGSTIGGLQVEVTPLTPKAFEAWQASRLDNQLDYSDDPTVRLIRCSSDARLGLAAGAAIRQSIGVDKFGLDAWDIGQPQRRTITLLPPRVYEQVTGLKAPPLPPTAVDYLKTRGWLFDYNESEIEDIKTSEALAAVKSVDSLLGKTTEPLPATYVVQKIG